jgi:hypothetical protein
MAFRSGLVWPGPAMVCLQGKQELRFSHRVRIAQHVLPPGMRRTRCREARRHDGLWPISTQASLSTLTLPRAATPCGCCAAALYLPVLPSHMWTAGALQDLGVNLNIACPSLPTMSVGVGVHATCVYCVTLVSEHPRSPSLLFVFGSCAGAGLETAFQASERGPLPKPSFT